MITVAVRRKNKFEQDKQEWKMNWRWVQNWRRESVVTKNTFPNSKVCMYICLGLGCVPIK